MKLLEISLTACQEELWSLA